MNRTMGLLWWLWLAGYLTVSIAIILGMSYLFSVNSKSKIQSREAKNRCS
jgi:hypothetical protein